MLQKSQTNLADRPAHTLKQKYSAEKYLNLNDSVISYKKFRQEKIRVGFNGTFSIIRQNEINSPTTAITSRSFL